MRRRTFLASTAVALAAPAIARGEGSQVLTFVPQADLAVLDPIWTTTYQTRDHGFLVFDTLFGLDSQFRPQPQMAEGAVSEDDGKTWRITLRPGLMFHDGTKVLARDCVASIKRWGARDGFGQALIAATDEIAASDDKTIRFRLKYPFPLLPDALAKTPPSICPIMPERLAVTDPYKQVTEMVGSGPYRYKADERVAGSRVVYERNTNYVPRPNGTPDGTAGPKIAYIDRIEWHIIPDPGTVAAALQNGEIDWWLVPQADLLPLLRKQPQLEGREHRPHRLRRDDALQPAQSAVRQSGDPARAARRGRAVRLHDRHGRHRRDAVERAVRRVLRRTRRWPPMPGWRCSPPSAIRRR